MNKECLIDIEGSRAFIENLVNDYQTIRGEYIPLKMQKYIVETMLASEGTFNLILDDIFYWTEYYKENEKENLK